MKLSILAATAASVIALSTTFAVAQTDMNRGQRGEPQGHPPASMAQPRSGQPEHRLPSGGMPMQSQGYAPQAQPGPEAAQPRTPEQATPDHQWANGPEDRGQASQAQPANPPGDTGEGRHGAMSQTQPMPPRNPPQHNEAAMPNGRQPTATDHFGGLEQRGALSQTQPTPPQHNEAANPHGRQPTATGHFSGREHVGVSAGPQHAPATEQFGSAHERINERFGATQRGNTRVQVAVGVTGAQRTQLRQRLAMVPLHRTGQFGFATTIGIAVPRSVALYPLPSAVAEVVPQFRGYSYVADQDEIVIVAPQTYRVAAVIPMGEVYYGSSTPHGVSGCR
jgi:hypothetical protein